MEPYRDDPTDPETRRVARQQQIQNMETAAAAGAGAAAPPTADPALAPHRSFVARRFLEGDDDLEDQGLSLIEEKVPSETPSVRTSDTGGNIFQRREQFEVDQSVNLMDATAAQYESKRRSGGRGLMKDSSMVDIFFDDHSIRRGGDRRGGSDRRTYRDIFCSTRFLVLITVIILGILLAAFSMGKSKGIFASGGGGGKGTNSTSTGTGNKETAPDQPKPETHAPTPDPNRAANLKLIAQNVSAADKLDDPSSHAHSALHWLTEDDKAQLGADDPGVLQRYVVAVLYFSCQPKGQPDAIFKDWVNKENWMSKEDVCNWHGIDCERISGYDAIVHLNLTSNHLFGTLPSKCQFLR